MFDVCKVSRNNKTKDEIVTINIKCDWKKDKGTSTVHSPVLFLHNFINKRYFLCNK